MLSLTYPKNRICVRIQTHLRISKTMLTNKILRQAFDNLTKYISKYFYIISLWNKGEMEKKTKF